MKTNRELDKDLGIKHITKPNDLEVEKYSVDRYNDIEYPYDSKYVNLPPKKRKKKIKSISKISKDKRVKKISLLKKILNLFN